MEAAGRALLHLCNTVIISVNRQVESNLWPAEDNKKLGLDPQLLKKLMELL